MAVSSGCSWHAWGHFHCGGRGPGGARRAVLWVTYFRWANVVTLLVICPGR